MLDMWLKANPLSETTKALFLRNCLEVIYLAFSSGRWDELHTKLSKYSEDWSKDPKIQILLRETFLRLANQALEAKRWGEAKRYLALYLEELPDDRDPKTLLIEFHCRLIEKTLEIEEYDRAVESLSILYELDHTQKAIADCIENYPFLAWLFNDSEKPPRLTETSFDCNRRACKTAFSGDGANLVFGCQDQYLKSCQWQENGIFTGIIT